MKFILSVILLYIFFILQITVIPALGLGHWRINLVLVGFIAMLLFFDLQKGYLWGFFIGILLNIFSLYSFDGYMVLFSLIPILIMFVFDKYDKNYNFLHLISITAISVIFFELIFYSVKIFDLSQIEQNFWFLFKTEIGNLFYNWIWAVLINCLLICPLFYYFFKILNHLIKKYFGDRISSFRNLQKIS